MAEKEEDLKRYNYIGFQTFPGTPKEFWKNAEEEKAFKEKLKKENRGLAFEREDSALHSAVLSNMERTIMLGGAALTILALFLPWFALASGGKHLSYGVLGFLGGISFLGSLGAWGSGLELPALIVMLALMLITPLLGIYYFKVLMGKARDTDSYYKKVKSVSKLFYIPIILTIITLLFTAFGFPMPFGNLGVEEIAGSFNILSFLSIASIGFYLTLAGSVICSLMALEL